MTDSSDAICSTNAQSSTEPVVLAEKISSEDWDAVRSLLTGCCGGDGGGAKRRTSSVQKDALAVVRDMSRCRDCPPGTSVIHYTCRFRPPPDVLRLLEALEEDVLTVPDVQGMYAVASAYSTQDPTGRHPLHIAVKNGASPETIALLLRRSASSAGVRDLLGKTPLHHFAESYAANYVPPRSRIACDSFDVVDGEESTGLLPLKQAAKLTAQLLLRADSSCVNAEDDRDMTPIEYAIESGGLDISVVKLLQKASEKVWKKKVLEDAERRRSAPREAMIAAARAVSSGDARPCQDLKPEMAAGASDNATRAVADLLGSVNLAAVSSALEKDKSVEERDGESVNVLIPIRPRQNVSKRALCA